MKLDLDPILAAEAESRVELHEVRLKGKKFILPAELPYICILAQNRGDEEGSLRPLLEHGEINKRTKRRQYEQWGDFIGLGLTLKEARVIFVELAEMYMRADKGESSASPGSSGSTSGRSRRTSRGSTKATSGKRSGESREPAKAG